jgi:Family of unknown function (DUF6093)
VKLNLKPVERMINSLMVDECMVRKGTQRRGHGTWDELLGSYSIPPDEILYYGPCMVTQQGQLPYTMRQGGGEQLASYYSIRIPLQDPPPDIQDEDELLVVDVHPEGDQGLAGTVFIVQAMDDATYSVCHILRALLMRQVPA